MGPHRETLTDDLLSEGRKRAQTVVCVDGGNGGPSERVRIDSPNLQGDPDIGRVSFPVVAPLKSPRSRPRT